jgi:hypothetical protein
LAPANRRIPNSPQIPPLDQIFPSIVRPAVLVGGWFSLSLSATCAWFLPWFYKNKNILLPVKMPHFEENQWVPPL